MQEVSEAAKTITGAVMKWKGVSSQPHRFGGIEFRLGKRELGHLHGNFLLDVPFPMQIRNDLVAAKRVQPHHIMPKSGWVSFYIRRRADVEEAVNLLKMSFELAEKHFRAAP